MKRYFLLCFILVSFLEWTSGCWGLERFLIPIGDSLVGEITWHTVSPKETLLDIARYYDLGYNQIVLANPKVDPWLPPVGKKVLIPSCYVLPPFQAGIVVNLAEMRLYFFRHEAGKPVVYTAPIGVGTEGKLTKLGVYTIIRKKKDPYWHVPESIRKEDPSLPEKVPPGPNNPLGQFAMYLSRESYAIHGTNKPWGIGRRVSHGCIRLYPEDIKALFPLVPVGTPVFIIYQPYKIGVRGRRVYLQAFPDFEKKISQPLFMVIKELNALEEQLGQKISVDLIKAKKVLEEHSGVPTPIGEIQWRHR